MYNKLGKKYFAKTVLHSDQSKKHTSADSHASTDSEITTREWYCEIK